MIWSATNLPVQLAVGDIPSATLIECQDSASVYYQHPSK